MLQTGLFPVDCHKNCFDTMRMLSRDLGNSALKAPYDPRKGKVKTPHFNNRPDPSLWP
jgi:hypothetical protein